MENFGFILSFGFDFVKVLLFDNKRYLLELNILRVMRKELLNIFKFVISFE